MCGCGQAVRVNMSVWVWAGGMCVYDCVVVGRQCVCVYECVVVVTWVDVVGWVHLCRWVWV